MQDFLSTSNSSVMKLSLAETNYACFYNLPLMEKVESCMFLCPSGLGPLQQGVLTADSGNVGVAQALSSKFTCTNNNSYNFKIYMT